MDVEVFTKLGRGSEVIWGNKCKGTIAFSDPAKDVRITGLSFDCNRMYDMHCQLYDMNCQGSQREGGAYPGLDFYCAVIIQTPIMNTQL